MAVFATQHLGNISTDKAVLVAMGLKLQYEKLSFTAKSEIGVMSKIWVSQMSFNFTAVALKCQNYLQSVMTTLIFASFGNKNWPLYKYSL